MDFGEALKHLKAGARVARAGWNGKGMFVYLDKGMPRTVITTRGVVGNSVVFYEPHITMFTARGTWQPGWLASQVDMLAEDWQLVT